MKKYILFLIGILLLSWGCKDTWIMYDPQTKDRLVLIEADTINTVIVTMTFEPENQMYYEIPVSLMGMPQPVDREFEIDILKDTIDSWTSGGVTTPIIEATAGNEYTIDKMVVPANSTKGYIGMTVNRKAHMLDNYCRVYFRIKETDGFTRLVGDNCRLLLTDGDPVCPRWWTNHYTLSPIPEWQMYLGKFSGHKYRKLLEYYWAMEELNPTFYNEMFEKYGRFLSETYIVDGVEQVTNAGFLSTERPTMWATYVLIPLYEYYKAYYAAHPEIEAEYMPGGTATGTNGSYWRDPINLLR